MENEVLNEGIRAQETQATQEQTTQEAAAQEPAVQTTQEVQEVAQFDLNQVNAFANSIINAQAQREQALREELTQKYEAQKEQETLNELSEDMRFLVEKLGLSNIKEEHKALKQENKALKQIVQSIKEEAAVTKLKAQIADMEAKVEGFNGKEIYNYLIELNKTNPQMAQALDNPQGWEMIHKSLHAQNPAPQSQTPQQNTQPAPDFILNGTQDTKFEPNEVMSKIKNGTATYADMGKIFG